MFSGTINVRGRLMDLSTPRVMGILNLTPDSFYSESRKQEADAIAARVREMVEQGADIIDVGAYSSRPGAADVSVSEEMARLRQGLPVLFEQCPDAVVSVDTFRADVARMCVEEYGVAIVNDISGGDMDPQMFSTVASLRVPYVLMHMQGTPQTMQQAPQYDNVLADVMLSLSRKVERLHSLLVNDVILDPGFGFGKTLEQNYELMARLGELHIMDLPLLVGVSRKSMISKLLGIDAAHALNGTTALNMLALCKGAHILRVHDVAEAVQTVRLYQATHRYDFNEYSS